MVKLAQLRRISPDAYEVERVFDHPSFSPGTMKTKQKIVEAPKGLSDAEVYPLIFRKGKWDFNGKTKAAAVPGGSTPKIIESPSCGEVFWRGHFYDFAGYAKANREILLRICNTLRVHAESESGVIVGGRVDSHVWNQLEALKKTTVSPRAPYVRFFVSSREEAGRYRINYTMMETETLHPGLADKINTFYEECWVPSEWNRSVFEESGVQVPVHVMPLGVNQYVFRPGGRNRLSPATAISGPSSGRSEVPDGFVFLSVFQPSFRKGVDVMVKAFERAFADDRGAALVFFVGSKNAGVPDFIGNLARTFAGKSRIYYLSGVLSERDLASLYRNVNAYVSASRGEGWNLPAMEAAATGIPVVLPKNTAHLDYATDDNSFLFNPEGFEVHPDARAISPWYEGQLFSKFGETSINELAECMRAVKNNSGEAERRAKNLMDLVRSRYTWDEAAGNVVRRILEFE